MWKWILCIKVVDSKYTLKEKAQHHVKEKSLAHWYKIGRCVECQIFLDMVSSIYRDVYFFNFNVYIFRSVPLVPLLKILNCRGDCFHWGSPGGRRSTVSRSCKGFETLMQKWGKRKKPGYNFGGKSPSVCVSVFFSWFSAVYALQRIHVFCWNSA